jgi:hypothetical protein
MIKMYQIIKPESMTNNDFFYFLYNKLGFTELKMSYNYKKDNELYWSTNFKYEDLLHTRPDQYIKNTWNPILKRPYTRNEVLSNVSHRSVLDIEILLDVDDTLLFNQNMFKTIKEKTQFILNQIRQYKPVVYFTGSKSYHISYILPELRFMSQRQRKQIKTDIITQFGCDNALSGENARISLEGATHYKSGQNKRLIKCY